MDMFLAVLFIIICVLLIIVVLLQKGRGGGLGAAFGGGGGSGAFGTKTGDVFTWVTIVLTALFLLLAVGTVLVFKKGKEDVPAPTFNPPPEQADLKKRPLVTLATPGRAEIRYTLDGSEPTKDSLKYNVPIEVSDGTIIKAFAIRGGQSSAVATAEYKAARPQSRPASGATSGPESTSRPKATSLPAAIPASVPASLPATAAALPS